MINEKLDRMKYLVAILNQANHYYYNTDKEVMSNRQYDTYYDELVKLEEETGVILAKSPTRKVGYDVVSKLEKKKHKYAAKSLDKTKDVAALSKFLGKRQGVLSWKLDGLTVVLTYKDGKLVDAVTRGNGEYGESILSNAKTFGGVPLTIPYKDELIVRGEALICYPMFNDINKDLPEGEKYKNPRNLVAGTVRQLDSKVCASRHVEFVAFDLVCGADIHTKIEELDFMADQGFDIVGHRIVNAENMEDTVKEFNEDLPFYGYAVDGLVLAHDDLEYGKSLGETSKFPLHSIAFKWADDLVETKLIDVEWSASRTGLINPVAIFEPVEIEGTTVERASLHNVDIFEELELGVGDTLSVFKANKIIPQVEENLTRSNTAEIPSTCPVCGEPTKVLLGKTARFLYCTNEICEAKTVKKVAHFASREAMNIDGLSEATIDKLIESEVINNCVDLYHISDHKKTICSMEGFGEKSYSNLVAAIDKSRNVRLENFIYALGVPNVGLSTAKLLVKWCKGDIDKIINAKPMQLKGITGIGSKMSTDIYRFFNKEENRVLIQELMKHIVIVAEEENTSSILQGKTFVITGDVHQFKNRKELQAKIESLGGRVSSSVSKNTDYLINNDSTSNSSKNKKAKECNVQIITELEFMKMAV